MTTFFEIIEDRAVRSIVAMTTRRKILQRPAHFIQHRNPVSQLDRTGKGKLFHLSTGAAAIVPQREKRANVFDGKAKVAGTPNEAQRMKVAPIIVAVAGVPARGPWN